MPAWLLAFSFQLVQERQNKGTVAGSGETQNDPHPQEILTSQAMKSMEHQSYHNLEFEKEPGEDSIMPKSTEKSATLLSMEAARSGGGNGAFDQSQR